MRQPHLLIALAWLCCAIGVEADLIVDSFTEGDAVLSLDSHVTGKAFPVSSPLGTNRFVRIAGRLASVDTTMIGELSSSSGSVYFSVDGQSIFEDRWLSMSIHYSQGGPFSITGYNAFVFDFEEIVGSGFLVVELGSQSDLYGPEAHRIPLSTAGSIDVPFDQLELGADFSPELFYSSHFTFEAETEQFSFTLNEIRLIPEPTSIACFLVGAFALLLKHRRPLR